MGAVSDSTTSTTQLGARKPSCGGVREDRLAPPRVGARVLQCRPVVGYPHAGARRADGLAELTEQLAHQEFDVERSHREQLAGHAREQLVDVRAATLRRDVAYEDERVVVDERYAAQGLQRDHDGVVVHLDLVFQGALAPDRRLHDAGEPVGVVGREELTHVPADPPIGVDRLPAVVVAPRGEHEAVPAHAEDPLRQLVQHGREVDGRHRGPAAGGIGGGRARSALRALQGCHDEVLPITAHTRSRAVVSASPAASLVQMHHAKGHGPGTALARDGSGRASGVRRRRRRGRRRAPRDPRSRPRPGPGTPRRRCGGAR